MHRFKCKSSNLPVAASEEVVAEAELALLQIYGLLGAEPADLVGPLERKNLASFQEPVAADTQTQAVVFAEQVNYQMLSCKRNPLSSDKHKDKTT